MKKVIPVFLVLILIGYFGYRSWEKSRAEKLDDRFYGTAEAEEVILSAQVPGQVLELNAQEGQAVKAGDLLARIDDASLQAQLKQANAAAHAAGSQAQVVAANLNGVNTEVARIEKLLASGSATTMQRDTLDTQKASLLAQKQAIFSQVGQAQAAAGVVETQIDHTRVTAPVGGTILRTHVQLGETVFPGSALLTLADLTTMEVYAYIPEPMLGRVKLGETVEVYTDAEPGKPLFGAVSHVADSAEFTPKNVQTKDERVRLIYKVKILVPNPDGVLKIGMPVDVRFAAR
jgi:HlyD family secretion protein